MSSVETALLTAINTRIASAAGATLRGLVTTYGLDMIPDKSTTPYLTWRPDDSDEFGTMNPGSDFYVDIPVIFTACSSSKGRLEAVNIRETCAALFRNAESAVTISGARLYDIQSGSAGTTEDANADGFISWQIFLFRLGTV